jgi:hypothetical protein
MSIDSRPVSQQAAAAGPYAHLTRLGAELRRRGWQASVTGMAQVALLTVTNPGAPALTEGVVCRRLAHGWHFTWPWEQPIGPVTQPEAVADRIIYVLRTVGG